MTFLKTPSDLSNLQKINPNSVIDFVERLNAWTSEKLEGRQLVVAIGTGGTISMRVENGISVPDLDFNKVLRHTNSDLSTHFQIESLDAFCIDSAQMNYSHTRESAIVMAYVHEHITVPFIGFFVTHGTDTMAYSAAALSLMMGSGLPFSVVYTGAQKPIQEPMNDAGVNVRNALFTLEALHNNNMAEIVIVMAERAMLATSAMKVDDTLVHAFDAPLHKYISKFSAMEYPIRLAPWLNTCRKEAFSPEIWETNYSRTLVVHSSLGLDPKRVDRQLDDPDIRAVLLFSYGAGTADNDIINAIYEKATARNLPMFVVSPVNARFKVVYESAKDMV
ncbi:MAG: asparaginase, partial [Alphaproteobacteria bacterium]|nr:asparaginase [Alphaproteobacteria bacterium]